LLTIKGLVEFLKSCFEFLKIAQFGYEVIYGDPIRLSWTLLFVTKAT